MAINVEGALPDGVTAKDLILAIIGQIGTGGGQGYIVEYRGEELRSLSMEGRMTVCNMSSEAGARAGLVAPDETTFEYLKGRPNAPQGADWDTAVAYWKSLPTDEGAVFDHEVTIDATTLTPYVTWGTNPGQALPLGAAVPAPGETKDPNATERALTYMGLTAGTALREIKVDTVFVGSCTNGRIEDLRVAAGVIQGRKVADGVRMLVVPGSMQVRAQAEAEGLNEVFTAAGAEWRSAGGSMCLGMNPDTLHPGERSASTPNRKFRGPPGKGRPPPAGAPGGGRRHGRHRPPDRPRRPVRRLGPPWNRSLRTPGVRCRCGAPTSTPTRSSRPCTSSGSPVTGSATGCSRPGARTRPSC